MTYTHHETRIVSKLLAHVLFARRTPAMRQVQVVHFHEVQEAPP